LALQAQVLPHHFHRDDLAVSQHRCRSTLAQALTLQHSWQGLVNNTKDGDNEVIPVHGSLLRSVAMVPEAIKRPGLGDFQLSKPAHRVNYHVPLERAILPYTDRQHQRDVARNTVAIARVSDTREPKPRFTRKVSANRALAYALYTF